MNWIWNLEKPMTVRYDYVGGEQVIYIGEAKVFGSATSAASWRIRKYTYDGEKVSVIQWAKSGATAKDHTDYNKIWDNRATYTFE